MSTSSSRERALRVWRRRSGQIPLARIDSADLVYAAEGEGYAPNSIVFVPFGKVAAAVS